jgi:hypothetical protein
MVTILLSSASITSGGLKMADGIGTYPNMPPGGWYRQAFDPLEHPSIVKMPPRGSEMSECAALFSFSSYTRANVRYVTKAGSPG